MTNNQAVLLYDTLTTESERVSYILQRFAQLLALRGIPLRGEVQDMEERIECTQGGDSYMVRFKSRYGVAFPLIGGLRGDNLDTTLLSIVDEIHSKADVVGCLNHSVQDDHLCMDWWVLKRWDVIECV